MKHSIRALLTAAAACASTPAAAKCTVGQMLELPVTMHDLEPMVPVTLDGHRTMLVADSGAFYSTISPGAAAEFHLSLQPAPFGLSIVGIGGSQQAQVAKIKDFGLAGITLHKIEFLVGGSEVGGAGLLGQNVLGIADVEYDLANGVLRLMKSSGCQHANLAYWAGDKPYSELPIELTSPESRHTRGTVILNGVRLDAIFDTGAATSILTRGAAARAGVKPGGPGVVDAGYSRGVGRGVSHAWIGPFDSLKIGDEEIKRIRLRFGDLGDEPDFDMLIGADFFLSHRVYVSNSQHKLFFTYNGGPVFDLTGDHATAGIPAAASAPPDAEALARRGMASAARHDFKAARVDLDAAVRMAPQDARWRVARARVEVQAKDRAAALADLDAALKADGADADARMLRAEQRFADKDLVGARQDADAVSTAIAPQDDRRLELSDLHDALDEPDAAVADADAWITAHPVDSRLPEALNDRCWYRALAGKDLSAALADCSRALRMRPHTPSFLDSRGLVRLRMGDWKRAIDDYDAALALDRDQPWSLYGRGLAKRKLGDTAGGDADIKAAKAIRPDIADEAAKHGITP